MKILKKVLFSSMAGLVVIASFSFRVSTDDINPGKAEGLNNQYDPYTSNENYIDAAFAIQKFTSKLAKESTKCIEGDCINGFGKLIHTAGLLTIRKWITTGEFREGKLNGKGAILIFDIDKKEFYPKITGTFKDGKLDGENCKQYKISLDSRKNWINCENCYYVGAFKNGNRDGKGILYNFKDQVVFDGYWEKDRALNYKANIKYDEETGEKISEVKGSFINDYYNSGELKKQIKISKNESGKIVKEEIIKYYLNGTVKQKYKLNPYSDIYYDENGIKYKSVDMNCNASIYYNNGQIKYSIDEIIKEGRDGVRQSSGWWGNTEETSRYYTFKKDSYDKSKSITFFHENGKIKYEGSVMRNFEILNLKTTFIPIGDIKIYNELGSIVFEGFIQPKSDYLISSKKIKPNELNGRGTFFFDKNSYAVNFNVFFSKSPKYGYGHLGIDSKGELNYDNKRERKVNFKDFIFDIHYSNTKYLVKEKNRKYHPLIILMDLIRNDESDWVLYNTTFNN